MKAGLISLFAVNQVLKYCFDPRVAHWNACKRIIEYYDIFQKPRTLKFIIRLWALTRLRIWMTCRYLLPTLHRIGQGMLIWIVSLMSMRTLPIGSGDSGAEYNGWGTHDGSNSHAESFLATILSWGNGAPRSYTYCTMWSQKGVYKLRWSSWE